MDVEKARKLLKLKKKITRTLLANLTVSDTSDLEKLCFAERAFDNLISKYMGY